MVVGRVETIISSSGLTVRKTTPTATVVKYTISNKPSSRTFSSILRTLFRIFAIYLFVMALAHRTWTFTSTLISLPFDFTLVIKDRLIVSSPQSTYSINNDFVVLASLIFLALAFLQREYVEDSILVLHDFGIQLSSTGKTVLSTSSEFIPLELVQDVILHEGFYGLRVIYFLAVIVKERERLLVVFPNTLPTRDILEDIWRDIRRCLYQQPATISIGKDTYSVENTVDLGSRQWDNSVPG